MKSKFLVFASLFLLTSLTYIFQRGMDTFNNTGGYGQGLPLGPHPDEPSERDNIHTHQFCEDCFRMRHLLSQWPSDKPKGVIYILTQKDRFISLTKLLRSLYEHFNGQYRYPIVIFYEEMDSNCKRSVKNISHADVFFQKVQFRIPSFLMDVKDAINCTSSIGYRHMCRFHAKGVYEEEILQDFDYHLRLDDDSLITRRVQYDIFQVMESHGYLYGYVWIHVDSYICIKGLWEAAKQYISDHRINPHFFSNWKSPKIFYNNFEVSSSKLWTSYNYKKYIDYIDNLGGIYYQRWGDAPIKGIAVSMFVPENKTYHFKDIGYKHGLFET